MLPGTNQAWGYDDLSSYVVVQTIKELHGIDKDADVAIRGNQFLTKIQTHST